MRRFVHPLPNYQMTPNPCNNERIMTPAQQLEKWVRGESVHNGAAKNLGECCPDFSCCHPDMLWPEDRRKEFAAVDDASRERMLLGGLSGLMDYHECRKVKILG